MNRALPILQEASAQLEQMTRNGVPCDTCTTANCCHDNYTMTLAEGREVVRYLRDERPDRYAEVRDRCIKRQDDTAAQKAAIAAKPGRWQRFKNWLTGRKYEVPGFGPCPMLDADNRCIVYPSRPLTCRTHYARPGVDPADCKVDPVTGAPRKLGVKWSTKKLFAFHLQRTGMLQEAGGTLETGYPQDIVLRAMHEETEQFARMMVARYAPWEAEGT